MNVLFSIINDVFVSAFSVSTLLVVNVNDDEHPAYKQGSCSGMPGLIHEPPYRRALYHIV